MSTYFERSSSGSSFSMVTKRLLTFLCCGMDVFILPFLQDLSTASTSEDFALQMFWRTSHLGLFSLTANKTISAIWLLLVFSGVGCWAGSVLTHSSWEWYTFRSSKTINASESALKHRDTVSCFCWTPSLGRSFTKGWGCTLLWMLELTSFITEDSSTFWWGWTTNGFGNMSRKCSSTSWWMVLGSLVSCREAWPSLESGGTLSTKDFFGFVDNGTTFVAIMLCNKRPHSFWGLLEPPLLLKEILQIIKLSLLPVLAETQTRRMTRENRSERLSSCLVLPSVLRVRQRPLELAAFG